VVQASGPGRDVPASRSGQLLATRPGVAAENLEDHHQASAWLDAEHQVLLAAITLANSQGRHADALADAEQALRLFQAVGHRPGEATMLNKVGWCHALLGQYEQARSFCQQALTLTAELGLPDVEIHVWDSLGYAEHHLGNLAEAAACYQHSLSMHQEFGDRYGEADVLTHLGDTRDAAGEPSQARDAWQQALDILDGLHHPDADQVRARLVGAGAQLA
jgi:tetratricopeptide (TPR) repeat protein